MFGLAAKVLSESTPWVDLEGILLVFR